MSMTERRRKKERKCEIFLHIFVDLSCISSSGSVLFSYPLESKNWPRLAAEEICSSLPWRTAKTRSFVSRSTWQSMKKDFSWKSDKKKERNKREGREITRTEREEAIMQRSLIHKGSFYLPVNLFVETSIRVETGIDIYVDGMCLQEERRCTYTRRAVTWTLISLEYLYRRPHIAPSHAHLSHAFTCNSHTHSG